MAPAKSARRQIRLMLLAALKAAKHGVPPEAAISELVTSGDRALTLDAFEFDSLAWMEFCIFVEDRSGQELIPAEIVEMRYFYEIEEWIYARV